MIFGEVKRQDGGLSGAFSSRGPGQDKLGPARTPPQVQAVFDWLCLHSDSPAIVRQDVWMTQRLARPRLT